MGKMKDLDIQLQNGDLLTLEEGAKSLGLSPSTLRVQAWKGKIATVRVGKRLQLVSKGELDRYAREQRR